MGHHPPREIGESFLVAGEDASLARMECSFCGKGREQVDRLIVGLIGVAICDDCVYLCVRVLQSDDDANQGATRIVRDASEGN